MIILSDKSSIPFYFTRNGYNKEHAIVKYLDYQIPGIQLKGPTGNGDM